MSPTTGDTSETPIVLIVDDDDDVRASLRELMLSVGIEVNSYASPRELLESEIPDRPGCLVLDVRMPGSSGLDLQQQLLSKGNAKPIVFLSGHGDIPMTVQAMKAGAVDFLTKPFRDQTLLDAVMAGIERDKSQRLEARTVKQYLERLKTLSPREREVLREVAQGRLNKQIAFDLGISEITVKLHRSNVMKKMQVSSIGQLIRAWEALPASIRDPASD
ncbi:response regulator transcription factor [Mycoplana sp. MJR14]|uniref:response regulator transcription factor n=1 Tax=Mycoplana sp. MJR14 TaxID=3032583 RepID=UPI000DD62D74|nr:response regulator transcription factor [Mycoplana sp. MJR14]MDF1633634.1 response regulator transcription factor [Mycoplana sp. MJR14]